MSIAAAASGQKPSMRAFALPGSASLVWLYALIGLLAAMHVSMVFGRSINWDEFWFYSQVEVVARGEFIQPLQTIHTRAFAWWLPSLEGTSVDHILIARLFMFVCLMVTAASIYLSAEKLSDKHSALLATAAYLGAGYVLHHGTAFRVDPIVSACLASGFAIAARTRLTAMWVLALGVLVGLAAMVTIKMVLWAPAFAGIALYRWEQEGFDRLYPLRWIAAGVIAIASFAALYFLHASGAGEVANSSASGTLGSSADRMIGFLDSPHLNVAAKGAAIALPLLIAALIAPFAVWTREASWAKRIALVAIWFPLLTPIYYYNSYPYFYAFILPSVAIVSAIAFARITRRYDPRLIAGVILASAAAIWVVDARGVTAKQQQLVSAVHEVFPQGVDYFDCCGMIGEFNKVNHFRTQWGVDQYLATGRPVMLETMRTTPVPLLIDNNSEFSGAMLGIETHTFHPDDIAAMRGTYIQHWGDIYVAGRDIGAGATLTWDVLVPGTYTVTGPLVIDGQAYDSGSLIELDRDSIVIENRGSETARLIWGDNPALPQGTPPEAYWTAF